MSKTVIQHVLSRLQDIGIKDVFGVAGDYAFPIDDAVIAQQGMRWIGSCNELNAAYSADGYARMHRVAALCTTYGVGELSAFNGIAGCYTEFSTIFWLVGMPGSGVQAARRLVHHTLGNGEFDLFYQMAAPVVCARAIMTPENCVAETERLIAAALYHRRPVYMAFPSDYANEPIVENESKSIKATVSDAAALGAVVDAIADAVSASTRACALPGILVSRSGLTQEAMRVIEAGNLPFATMFMDKSVLNERHPNYIGMYDGRLMDEDVRAFVEGSDCVLSIGAMFTDFSSGSFTANIERAKSINIMHNNVRVGTAYYENVLMKDVLVALSKRLTKKSLKPSKPDNLGKPLGRSNENITAEYLYPRWEQMLRENDIVFTETGTSSLGLAFALMPKGSTFQNQTLWGSIGWATPASFGAALSSPNRRTILITGEGSHQLTVQEISQFYRFGLKPIIFVLNNNGYLIERLLSGNPDGYYNDLAQWNYEKLPTGFGCNDWFTARVTTCGELDEAIKAAETCGTGSYIEVVTGNYVAPPLAQKYHDSKETLYASDSVPVSA